VGRLACKVGVFVAAAAVGAISGFVTAVGFIAVGGFKVVGGFSAAVGPADLCQQVAGGVTNLNLGVAGAPAVAPCNDVFEMKNAFRFEWFICHPQMDRNLDPISVQRCNITIPVKILPERTDGGRKERGVNKRQPLSERGGFTSAL
jgi:hypothetical protein